MSRRAAPLLIVGAPHPHGRSARQPGANHHSGPLARRTIRAVACACATSDGHTRQAAPAQGIAFDADKYRIPHKRFVLDNGLTLLVHEDHAVPSSA